jgi:fructose-1,6-bisphosphatase/sedoheptulose 1,7-bisphosphatase-like protein
VHIHKGGCITTESIVMRAYSGTVRRVRTEHRKGA